MLCETKMSDSVSKILPVRAYQLKLVESGSYYYFLYQIPVTCRDKNYEEFITGPVFSKHSESKLTRLLRKILSLG